MIYAPGFIQPQKVTQLVSQIDLMPTVLGLLHFNYDSKFIGQDVFSPNYKERALIATYQDLGLIKNNRLTIISPKQKVKQFDLKLQQMEGVSPEFQSNYEEIPVKKMDEKLVKETIAYYQFTTDLLQKKQYQKK
jgi:phosphoglycerol transferase MdoB-like AlkP superfamily enzyme